VCAVFGFDEDLLIPISMADFEYDAPRPLDSTLDITKIRDAIGFEPTPMGRALERIRTQMPGR